MRSTSVNAVQMCLHILWLQQAMVLEAARFHGQHGARSAARLAALDAGALEDSGTTFQGRSV
jgi:hypothetical protein